MNLRILSHSLRAIYYLNQGPYLKSKRNQVYRIILKNLKLVSMSLVLTKTIK
jgi:hypothetical protein